ncbi:hypothetical protein Halru_2919 [Halovivax ruber XH-70]|uniref:Uncharacterized protein n=1 Tax=Halovivax ruber (strain DSM 18193 / JCM 13892 / XH-70) TaxID=797302 RepID=L0IFF3_HALRX|nr:hypothetical protein [Halovivax ruber]AGB17489.1 hypothetical protein Halru_2919 [Halovivax ruber XH-70]
MSGIGSRLRWSVRLARTNRRAIGWGALAAVGVFALFGVVTGLIENPLYVRMVPRTPVDYLLLTVTAILAGVYVAQRLATAIPGSADAAGEDRWAIGGLVGGFLAVGCPICNVFLLALFSSSALMTYFDPLRPILGLVSVAMLGGLIYVRNRRSCLACSIE